MVCYYQWIYGRTRTVPVFHARKKGCEISNWEIGIKVSILLRTSRENLCESCPKHDAKSQHLFFREWNSGTLLMFKIWCDFQVEFYHQIADILKDFKANSIWIMLKTWHEISTISSSDKIRKTLKFRIRICAIMDLPITDCSFLSEITNSLAFQTNTHSPFPPTPTICKAREAPMLKLLLFRDSIFPPLFSPKRNY